MKNKSTRHKEANTFKFQPFSERVSSINVDVFHRVAHEYETAVEEETSFFYQAIQKWNVLNLTESYGAFRKEINAGSIITLAQLLHNKDNAVQTLLKHLKHKNVLCLQPLLELTVALAQDLRKDFCQYYPDFLDVLIELLDTKDADQLEWVFTCLAYLFKFLWRTLITDVGGVFRRLLPLLSDTRPQYVNDFAAESFAFVARKVRDRRAFLALILKSIKNDRDGITGCGQLLFEVVNGTNGQFHSCADGVLAFYFDCLEDEKLPQRLLREILEQVVLNVISKIQVAKGELFWQICVSQLEAMLLTWLSSRTERTSDNLSFVLQCLGLALEHKGGRFLQNAAVVIGGLSKLFSVENLPDTVLLTASKLVVLLIVSRNVKLQQEQASTLTRKVLALPSKAVLLYFVENSLAASSFEALILPSFLKLCVIHRLDDESLRLLSLLIWKKMPLCDSGIQLEEWNRYTIDFGSRQNDSEMQELLHNHICVEDLNQMLDNIDNYLLALICLPHLTSLDIGRVGQTLARNVEMLCRDCELAGGDMKKLFVLYSTLECAVHIVDGAFLAQLSIIMGSVLSFCNDVTYLCALRVLDLYITAVRNVPGAMTKEMLVTLHAVLEKNFSSPYHEVRLLTTHIYSLFENTLDLRTPSSPEEWNVFGVCYKIESIEPLVHTYREQVLLLEKLNFDKPQMAMCKDTEFRTVPLRYLCGVLYMNFKLLWEPVVKIVSAHATGLDVDVFWNFFSGELRAVVERIRKGSCDSKGGGGGSGDFPGSAFLNDLCRSFYAVQVEPDFANYRLLLWKALCSFPEIAEIKTKDVSEIFLDFIEKEYIKTNTSVALTWNIRQNPNASDEKSTRIEVKSKAERVCDEVKPTPSNLKTLIQHLTVFTKVRSPKSVYREPELLKLYLELLSHKNNGIQKLALDCLATYKFKYITPYASNLYNLIDDKTFKNALATFSVDKESSTIQEGHRENLVPIVIKIVFSKMVAKTGLRTGGKASGQLRRNLIFRFLAGCHESEMMSFVHMAFRYYEKYFEDCPEAMVANISDGVDLEKFIPPKKLQSTVNLLSVVLEQFGGLMGEDLLKFLLKIILIVGAALRGASRQVVDVHSGYLSILRNLRMTSTKLIERFFEHFELYPWTAGEINAVFDVFVWPYLDKLNVEGIHGPTALFKVLVLWGTHPRYFPLLVKHKANDESRYALPRIMLLLLNEKCHVSVVNAVMEMVEKLLTLQPGEEDLALKLPVENELGIRQDILDRLKLSETLNYGSCILLPHVDSVLEKIRRKLSAKSKVTISRRHLFVLSRISELVWESGVSDTLLQLLLPVVLKKCSTNAGEEVASQLLTTVSNLMQNVSDPRKHLKQIAPLFGEVGHPSARKILCHILTNVGERMGEELSVAGALLAEMNAWDSKWVDQPDFQRRSDAFRLLQKMVDESSVPLELGILTVYNCYYLIRSEKDLSLRENAGHCLRTLCPALIKNYPKARDINYVLDETLLNLIRKGLRNKSDDLRNECLSLLGGLARECAEHHVVLRDLGKLTSKADPEVDFFENMTHMQVHRHARALLKFCSVFRQEPTLPNMRTMTQFILPLASHYLCNERYANKNSIVDAAVETMAVACRLLPWHHYEALLKFYLGRLRYKVEYQKQLVRVTVAVLDAFHFDLGKGQVDSEDCTEAADDTQNAVNEHENKGEGENEATLDDILGDDVGEASDEEGEVEALKPYEKITVLCRSTANRVVHVIKTVLLPQLHKVLAEMTRHDTLHKVNRKKISAEREEDDLLRIPMSLAVVKLLQKLPRRILESNLPGVFMKLCSFLKSPLESVRRVTRETLQKIMIALGPQYLRLLLDEMAPLLSRGFQVHVLVYTTHSVLSHLKQTYGPKDIDRILLTVVNLCRADLFGSLAEEKEVAKIVSKVSEAKATKSYDTLQILAQFITERCLMDLVLPIRDVLTASHSYKVVHKAQDCLRHIALGLVDNEFVSAESLLKFSYGTASESIPELLPGKDRPVLTDKERENMQRQKPDCFIIPKEPVYRSGHRTSGVKSSAKTNAHVLVEFGLRLCHFLLKRDKVHESSHKAFMDPFVGVFKNCLRSKHIKLSVITLQCLGRLMKYDLPSLREDIDDIAASMFEILHKYAAAGLSKGDNFDLVVAAFKAMSVLVRDVKYHTIDAAQLKILLLYVEQDLHDYDRQATAFGLLKAIVSRKLIVPEIHDVMQKVAELSITSESTHVRLQSRLVFHQFLMDYPLATKLAKYVSFCISQLAYETQSGRESALELIQNLINSFPMNVLKEYSGTFLVTLGARLVNDESPECRKMAADCISTMFARLPRPDIDPLFDIIMLWLKDNKINHRRLAAQLCGVLVMAEKSSFESRIEALMPVILAQFGLEEEEQRPGRCVLLKARREHEVESEGNERIKDHHMFQTLQLLLKICAHCPCFLKQSRHVQSIATHVQTLLAHPHDWVRLAAAQFLGFVLSSLNVEHLAELLRTNKSDETCYLYSDPSNGVKSLTLDLCSQLQPNSIKGDLAEQVVKNLVFLARVLQKVPRGENDDVNRIDLFWLTKRMRKVVNTEVVEAPSSNVLRTEVFKWIGGLGAALDLDKLLPILRHLLAPLVREMITTEESNAPLRQLSKEVGNLLKKRVGVETYTATLSKVQQQLSVRRAERKRTRTQLAVTDPELYARKKIKHHEKKKEMRKRKMSGRKGKVWKVKRRKVVDLEDGSEIM